MNSQIDQDLSTLQQQVNIAIRRLLSEQNRDPYAPAYGCFDRRYWAWKLIDFPEATFQRNVYPLAWKLQHLEEGDFPFNRADLELSVIAGLRYAFQIQHRDGSFDQAFPNEHSYGATAFLLQPLLESFKIIRNSLDEQEYKSCQDGLYKAAQFLCSKSETHGLISNHLAGAALSLLLAGSHFNEKKFQDCGLKMVSSIVSSQNSEGWFPEYGGADPGYQTLCVYYLAQIYRRHPDPALKAALIRAVEFLSWFVHPDGSFGGEYGSRRTAVYYPGGIALLADEIPLAAAMTARMVASSCQGHTVTLQDIDVGNLAPLLQNFILTLDALAKNQSAAPELLPCDRKEACADFPAAGLSIRGNEKYYSVVGISNGGVVKVFQKGTGALVYDDSGYTGRLKNGKLISTQMTRTDHQVEIQPDCITLTAPFYEMLRSLPTPAQFVVLRILNLTFMRSISFGNWIKDVLVNLLIQGEKRLPLNLTRTIKFHDSSIEITDLLELTKKINLLSLSYGKPFTSIHMASARYFQGQSTDYMVRPEPVNIAKLNEEGQITQKVTI